MATAAYTHSIAGRLNRLCHGRGREPHCLTTATRGCTCETLATVGAPQEAVVVTGLQRVVWKT